MRAVKVSHRSWVPARVTRVELESGFLPTPAGSAALSVSWRARSRQIRDHHRAQRRGSSRRYKRRLTLLQEGVSWLHSLLCSAPLRALDIVTQQGPGLSEIAFIHAPLRQSMNRSFAATTVRISWSLNIAI